MVLIKFVILFFIIVIPLLFSWLWALIDVFRGEFTNSTNKVVWILLIFFLPILGALLYLIIGRGQKILPDRKVQESDRLKRARDFAETANREKYKGNNESALDNYQNAMYEIDQILVNGNSYDKSEARKLRDNIESSSSSSSSSSVESSIPQATKKAPPRKINIKVLASITIAIILLLVFSKQISSIIPNFKYFYYLSE